MRYRVLIEPDEDGVTRTDAIANIKEAIAAYLESLQKHGEPVPPPVSEEVVVVNL